MIQDEFKTVTVVSSAGSGNVFCQKLLQGNLKVNIRWVRHNIDEADKNGINIIFIRNPYDNIASNLELQFATYGQQEQQDFLRDPIVINNKIEAIVKSYENYIEHSKKFDYITPITFDLLTKKPDKFLEYMSKKFDIPYLETRLSAENAKKSISTLEGLQNRIPRDKSDMRKLIDSHVSSNAMVLEAYKKYVEYINIIQSTENMV
jgi:hypothetical protein